MTSGLSSARDIFLKPYRQSGSVKATADHFFLHRSQAFAPRYISRDTCIHFKLVGGADATATAATAAVVNTGSGRAQTGGKRGSRGNGEVLKQGYHLSAAWLAQLRRWAAALTAGASHGQVSSSRSEVEVRGRVQGHGRGDSGWQRHIRVPSPGHPVRGRRQDVAPVSVAHADASCVSGPRPSTHPAHPPAGVAGVVVELRMSGDLQKGQGEGDNSPPTTRRCKAKGHYASPFRLGR